VPTSGLVGLGSAESGDRVDRSLGRVDSRGRGAHRLGGGVGRGRASGVSLSLRDRADGGGDGNDLSGDVGLARRGRAVGHSGSAAGDGVHSGRVDGAGRVLGGGGAAAAAAGAVDGRGRRRGRVGRGRVRLSRVAS
jgi:hypothetical protein